MKCCIIYTSETNRDFGQRVGEGEGGLWRKVWGDYAQTLIFMGHILLVCNVCVRCIQMQRDQYTEIPRIIIYYYHSADIHSSVIVPLLGNFITALNGNRDVFRSKITIGRPLDRTLPIHFVERDFSINVFENAACTPSPKS